MMATSLVETIQVPVSSVVIPEGRRPANQGKVASLAQSMATSRGQMHSILVRLAPPNILIAGRHRLEAASLLQWETIRADVHDVSEDEAKLMEIDENLERHDLTAMERDVATAERKEIYLKLHPETAAGVAGGTASGKSRSKGTTLSGSVVPEETSFVADTAAKTGLAESTIRQYVQVGAALKESGAADILMGTPVADRQKELLYLSKMDAGKQVAIATLIRDGESKSVYDAEKKLKGVPERTSEESNRLVIEMQAQGASKIDIAAALGVTVQSLNSRLASPGFKKILDEAMAEPELEPEPAPVDAAEPVPAKKICSRSAESTICDLYRSGMSTDAIAKQTGFTWATITKYVLPIETERMKNPPESVGSLSVLTDHFLEPVAQDLNRLHSWMLEIQSTGAADLSIPAALILQALQAVQAIQELEVVSV